MPRKQCEGHRNSLSLSSFRQSPCSSYSNLGGLLFPCLPTCILSPVIQEVEIQKGENTVTSELSHCSPPGIPRYFVIASSVTFELNQLPSSWTLIHFFSHILSFILFYSLQLFSLQNVENHLKLVFKRSLNLHYLYTQRPSFPTRFG